MNNKKNILIVGGAGYIGSELTKVLLKNNFKVTVLDLFIFNKDSLNNYISHKNLRIIKANIVDTTILIDTLKNINTIVHLAGIVGDPACAYNLELTNFYNCYVTEILVKSCISKNIQFIFASSCLVYGSNNSIADENTMPNPTSLYAKTKFKSEKYILKHNSSNFSPTILRFSTLFGHSSRMRFDLVANLFVAKAYNDGMIKVNGINTSRAFIHLKDICDAIVKTVNCPIFKVKGEIFNVGENNNNITLYNLSNIVKDTVKKDRNGNNINIEILESIDDQINYNLSFDKIKNVLNYSAKVSIKAGIGEIYQNLKNEIYTDYNSNIYHNVKMMSDFENSFNLIKDLKNNIP